MLIYRVLMLKNTSRYQTTGEWPYFERWYCQHLPRNHKHTDENERIIEEILLENLESLGLREKRASYSNDGEFARACLSNGDMCFDLIKTGTTSNYNNFFLKITT